MNSVGVHAVPVLEDRTFQGVDYADAFLSLSALVTWYQVTRHTFASQCVMAGGSIEKLKEILGHYSVVVTERYAHLTPERDLNTPSMPLLRDCPR